MSEPFDELESEIGVPSAILERSANARAEAQGVSTEAVIAEWTGSEAPPAPSAAPAEPAAAAPATTTDLPAAASLSGEALLEAAAQAKGIPLSLVERSAQARADADGVPVEEVMRGWVIEAGLAAAGAVVEAAPPAPAPEPAQPAQPAPTAEPEATPTAEPSVEVLEPTAEVPEPVATEPATAVRYPGWLAAAMVIIPLLAVLYVLVVPDQPSCGSAGQLAIDPATGAVANCDGSPFGQSADNPVVAGGEIFASSCAACHGAGGEGVSAPALAGGSVLATFPEGMCASHIQWVTGGSEGWPEGTYGAQNKPVQGGMPAASSILSEEEITQVVLYERVVLGGEEQAAAEVDCGYADEAGEPVAAP